MEISGKKIAVWFSCGVASAVAAKKTIELYGDRNNVFVVNNPVLEEHHDNQRFLHDIENWIGVKIEKAINPKYPTTSIVDVFNKRKYMSGVKGAPCTLELKKNARVYWESMNNPDWHVLGFTFDEIKRHKSFTLSERQNVLPVLIDLKLTKQDCFKIINEAGIEIPKIYKIGFPNANCIGCVKASSPTYWNLVRNKFPSEFNVRAKQSREIGARLVRYKGKRIFLDELPLDAKGRDIKNMSIECGIFCEEK
jgi:hypothetical protein